MKTLSHVMLLQIPQIMAFIRIEPALRNSRDVGVITTEEYQAALAAISERCDGMYTEDWFAARNTTVNSYTRKEFLKYSW